MIDDDDYSFDLDAMVVVDVVAADVDVANVARVREMGIGMQYQHPWNSGTSTRSTCTTSTLSTSTTLNVKDLQASKEHGRPTKWGMREF
jgi:hypothetical protein